MAIKREMKKPASGKDQSQKSGRGRTMMPGQNPRANDDPSHDEHHDENRPNTR